MNIPDAREMVKRYETVAPDALDWAEDAMLNHTTYSRRRYGNSFYTWADCAVVDPATGKQWHCDPWPAASYPRSVLLAMLTWAKIHNPNLCIASAVQYAA